MMYLADTCVVVEHINQTKEIKVRYVEAGLAISSITYAELMYGVNKSAVDKMANNLKKIHKFIETCEIRIIPIDEQVAITFGQEKARLAKIGLPTKDPDLLIAATAMAHNLKVLTYNTKDFMSTQVELVKLQTGK